MTFFGHLGISSPVGDQAIRWRFVIYTPASSWCVEMEAF